MNYSTDIKNNPYNRDGVEDDLSKLIVGLYDEAVNTNNKINLQCMDMWDLMFKYRVGSIRSLSKSIMEY
ncbi:hypothetical protein [Clostridium gasigenes]|uniref:Uncharacterized protein n=1 Tax=Clostridium gasigenes TaxID=94869 RepID=A0A7X0VTC2_9CLOT|nr:hypothetical protein [Clostridium gasigenes]MBB6716838.1 hypothetical protein [Clostridium gasigenes]